MNYVQSEKHFINLCCKKIRDNRIAFKNHNEFLNDLKEVYKISEEIEPLTYGNRLVDIISWKLLQETPNTKEAVLHFFNDTLQKIINEAIDIYNQKLDRNFVYLKPIFQSETIDFKKLEIPQLEKAISPLAIKELNKLENCYGIYFIYNDKDQLIYIGKSKNLAHRIIQSIKKRRGTKFAYILVKNPADIHILEPYLIVKYKPLSNTEFIELGDTSFELNVPPISKIIPIYEEV